MNSLLATVRRVHSNRLEADRAASVPAADLAAAVGTDRAWISEEAETWETRAAACARTEPGLDETCRLVAALLTELVGSMAFHRIDSAALYLSTSHAGKHRYPAGPPRFPFTPSTRSALAASLETEAAYYAHLDTAAGDLVARHLLATAADAAWYGCTTPQDLTDAEAAFAMAMVAAMEDDPETFGREN